MFVTRRDLSTTFGKVCSRPFSVSILVYDLEFICNEHLFRLMAHSFEGWDNKPNKSGLDNTKEETTRDLPPLLGRRLIGGGCREMPLLNKARRDKVRLFLGKL